MRVYNYIISKRAASDPEAVAVAVQHEAAAALGTPLPTWLPVLHMTVRFEWDELITLRDCL